MKTIFLALLLTSYQAHADPCGAITNSDGVEIKWSNLPVRFLVNEEFPRDYLQALQSAMDTWNKAAGRSLFELAGTSVSNANSDGNTIFWSSQWEDKFRFEQAHTTIRWNVSNIYKSDIFVNAETYRWSLRPSYVDLDVESVLVKQLGHALGFRSTDNDSSVMARYLSLGQIRRTLSDEDIKKVKCAVGNN